jgi:NAD(P)-dependent dehydrogenase (short-subunit alcohol dehydrogenase family)
MKHAVVTGGAGDIGLATARALVAEGWHVGLIDLDPAAVRAAADGLGGAATPLPCDVTDAAALSAAFDALGAPPDLAVCNAGIGRFGPLVDMDPADFRKVLEVNLTGAFLTAQAAAKRMIPHGRGAIVTITSINALVPGPGAGAYPAAKAGLAKLTEQMALEWGPLGLRCNAIAPGFIDAGISTPFFRDQEIRARRERAVPSRRLGLAEDIANAVLFLASDGASYVNGHQLVVDGGVTPSLLAQLPRSKND